VIVMWVGKWEKGGWSEEEVEKERSVDRRMEERTDRARQQQTDSQVTRKPTHIWWREVGCWSADSDF